MRKTLQLIILALAAVTACGTASADEYHLVVQPVIPAKDTLSHYAPLVAYLSRKTGEKIKLVAATNFLSYWETMKKAKEYDIILDGAHFTDFRIRKLGYKVIAKIPDKVSYTLVCSEDELILEADELVGKRVAHMPSPSLGAIHLVNLFPNLARQPISVEAADSYQAIDHVLKGKAQAAIVPTPILNQYNNLNVISSTRQIPHMGISVSPRVPPELATRLQKALIEAKDTPEGQEMLNKINFPGFVPATADIYAGQHVLLKGTWGYKE